MFVICINCFNENKEQQKHLRKLSKQAGYIPKGSFVGGSYWGWGWEPEAESKQKEKRKNQTDNTTARSYKPKLIQSPWKNPD